MLYYPVRCILSKKQCTVMLVNTTEGDASSIMINQWYVLLCSTIHQPTGNPTVKTIRIQPVSLIFYYVLWPLLALTCYLQYSHSMCSIPAEFRVSFKLEILQLLIINVILSRHVPIDDISQCYCVLLTVTSWMWIISLLMGLNF